MTNWGKEDLDATEICKTCGKRSDPDRMLIQGDGYICVTCYSKDVADRREEIHKISQSDQGREEGAGPVFQPLGEVVPEPFSTGSAPDMSTGDPASRTLDPASAKSAGPGSSGSPAGAGFPSAGWIAGLAALLGFIVKFYDKQVTIINGDSDVFYRDYGAISAGVIALIFGFIAMVQIMKTRSRGLGLCIIILFLGVIHLLRGFGAFGT